MKLKESLTEYTESEFLELINTIYKAEGSDQFQDDLLEHFIEITEHPRGSDVIYYPDKGQEDSPAGILHEVKSWRFENGKPGFREA